LLADCTKVRLLQINENVLKGENQMKKKIFVLLVVLLLLASTLQVAFAAPPPVDPDNDGACNMVHSWWPPVTDPDTGEVTDTGPGNANGVQVQDGQYRGMFHVHNSLPHGESIGGANMFSLTGAHCP
jgi:hypothetical protein